MAERTVAQRVALERSLYRIPLLRRALREKRISYEKRAPSRGMRKEMRSRAWIEKAETMTCVELRRAMQDKDEAQMCARGTFRVWMPVSVAEVVKTAFRAAPSRGEALVIGGESASSRWRSTS